MTSIQFLAGNFGSIQSSGGQSIAEITLWQLQCRIITKTYQSNLTGSDTVSDVGVKHWSGTFDFMVPGDQSYSWQEATTLTDVQFHVDGTGSNYIQGDILIQKIIYRDEVSENKIVRGTAIFEGQGAYQRFGTLAMSS